MSFLKLIADRINLQDDRGRTALHDAVDVGEVEDVQILLEAGANCNIVNDLGETPLELAMINNYKDKVKILVASNPNLNFQSEGGTTALHVAATIGSLEFVDMLLDSGARFDIVDEGGRTCIWHLISEVVWRVYSRGDFFLLEKILDRTREIVILDHATGDRAIHCACKYIHHRYLNINVIKFIVSKQEDINVKNHCGKTSLNLLLEHSVHLDADEQMILIQFMIQNGAYMNNRDHEIISGNDTLYNGLFSNTDFCTQAIMNKFNYELLQRFYSLLNPRPDIPTMEVLRMSLIPQVSRVIRSDVISEINRKGYCNVASLVTTSLSKHCIETYVSHRLQQITLQNKLHSEEKSPRDGK